MISRRSDRHTKISTHSHGLVEPIIYQNSRTCDDLVLILFYPELHQVIEIGDCCCGYIITTDNQATEVRDASPIGLSILRDVV